MSYHDVEIEFAGQPKIAIFDAPFNWELTCTRSAGWQLWEWENAPISGKCIRSYVAAGEYKVIRLSIWNKGILMLDGNEVRS